MFPKNIRMDRFVCNLFETISHFELSKSEAVRPPLQDVDLPESPLPRRSLTSQYPEMSPYQLPVSLAVQTYSERKMSECLQGLPQSAISHLGAVASCRQVQLSEYSCCVPGDRSCFRLVVVLPRQ